MKKSTLYTRTGDAGTTSLVGGTRASKASCRLEAYGTADELNSHIGLLIAMDGVPQGIRDRLQWVQNRLFDLGAQLATEPESPYQPQGISEEAVEAIEHAIDEVDSELPRHNQFLLPGGHIASAQANVARTVCRRCERRMVSMVEQGIEVADTAMRFVNRLSDYLFAVSRAINLANSCEEVPWEK